jgi:hypothetical protein
MGPCPGRAAGSNGVTALISTPALDGNSAPTIRYFPHQPAARQRIRRKSPVAHPPVQIPSVTLAVSRTPVSAPDRQLAGFGLLEH